MSNAGKKVILMLVVLALTLGLIWMEAVRPREDTAWQESRPQALQESLDRLEAARECGTT